MTFEITSEKYAKFLEWREELIQKGIHDNKKMNAIGGAFSFLFVPTGLGMALYARHISGEELDLTDWEKF